MVTKERKPLIEVLIEKHGSVAKCAEAFGVTRMTIYQWRKHGVPVSIKKAMDIGKEIDYAD